MSPRRAVLALVSSLCALALVSCKKPKPGDDCKTEGAQLCVDKASSIVCAEGKWETLPCRGTLGCSSSGGEVTCQNDGYLAGEACDPAQDDHECSTDKKSDLKCTGSHWKEVDRCLGPSACKSTAREVSCDNTVSEDGAPCISDGDTACSRDGKSLLLCSGNKMTVHEPCRGDGGCKSVSGKPTCDTSIAEVGDACDEEGFSSCSVDRKSVLLCKEKRRISMRACKTGCRVSAGKIECN